jgi:hypothetical protein
MGETILTLILLEISSDPVHAQNDEIRRQSSERFTIYRRCKVEDIELPLSTGSLAQVPLEEVGSMTARLGFRLSSESDGISTYLCIDRTCKTMKWKTTALR